MVAAFITIASVQTSINYPTTRPVIISTPENVTATLGVDQNNNTTVTLVQNNTVDPTVFPTYGQLSGSEIVVIYFNGQAFKMTLNALAQYIAPLIP